MEEFIGLLKVRVIKGTNLVAGDLTSSDPYVVVRLGNQKVTSRTVKSDLNPVWDDELTVGVPKITPPLKLEVMDKDTLSRNEFLGQAILDLQPLIATAKKYEFKTKEKGIKENYQAVASQDNSLDNDSYIFLRNGEIIQSSHLNLKEVKSGEIEIELRWIYI